MLGGGAAGAVLVLIPDVEGIVVGIEGPVQAIAVDHVKVGGLPATEQLAVVVLEVGLGLNQRSGFPAGHDNGLGSGVAHGVCSLLLGLPYSGKEQPVLVCARGFRPRPYCLAQGVYNVKLEGVLGPKTAVGLIVIM